MSDVPRFYVVGVYGAPIIGDGRGAGRRLGWSYSVLDSAQCHREVYTAYTSDGGGSSRRLFLCEREAARRNALDAAGCAA